MAETSGQRNGRAVSKGNLPKEFYKSLLRKEYEANFTRQHFGKLPATRDEDHGSDKTVLYSWQITKTEVKNEQAKVPKAT